MGTATESDAFRPVESADARDSDRMWALFTHLALLAFAVIPIPVVPSLVMWLVKRSDSEFIDDHGKEAVNFQISLVIYGVAAAVLTLCGIGVLIGVALPIFGVVMSIVAAVAAGRGRYYRYPMCIRFIS